MSVSPPIMAAQCGDYGIFKPLYLKVKMHELPSLKQCFLRRECYTVFLYS
jgi:hypothetical protein